VPVLARIAKIDRELHLMSPTSKSQRDALIKERRSLVRQLAFIDKQMSDVR
jgi:hypothetical protein